MGIVAGRFNALLFAGVVVVTLALVACGEEPPSTPTPLAPTAYERSLHLFDYDQQAPLDLQEVSVVEHRDGITQLDITYASPRGGRVPATLVVPDGPGPFAGLIFQHGCCGPGGFSARRQFVATAVSFARTGAVVLLIDAPFARPENIGRDPITFTEQDRNDQIQLIVDLRRGVDLLTARGDVDQTRIAYVGISYGAGMGGLLAGVEKRVKAYVLAVGAGGLIDHFCDKTRKPYFCPVEPLTLELRRERWLKAMEPIEPIHFVGHAAPAALFFQNARHDTSVEEGDALRYQQAGSEPKRVKWYDSGHDLPTEAILDQVEWLQLQIGIDASSFQIPWNY